MSLSQLKMGRNFRKISLFVLIFIITHPSSLLVRCSADVGVIDCEDLISASETLTGVCRGKYLASGTKIFSNHCTCRRPSEDEGYKYPLPVLASHNVEAQTSALFVEDNLTRLPVEMFYIWSSNYNVPTPKVILFIYSTEILNTFRNQQNIMMTISLVHHSILLANQFAVFISIHSEDFGTKVAVVNHIVPNFGKFQY